MPQRMRGETVGQAQPPRAQYDVQRLLAVAVEVFIERGYDGTSMDEIAAMAATVGAAFGVSAMVNDGAANGSHNCVRDICNAAGESDRQRVIEDAHVADVMLAVGLGAAATGVALWFIGSKAPRRASGVYVQPAIAERAWSLSVGRGW